MTLTVRDDARREIQKDVDALTQSPRHFNIKAERAKTYFPIVEKIFAEERLPDDFKYLCLQESALIPDAVSSSNAVGFWQFKDFTAREMGLRIDAEVDERINIASASRAAARYLKQNNHYFNNWIYALQSYQMGAGGVMRAVGEKDLGVRHMEITTDTYWYVKKYLAHKVAFENAVQGKPALEVSHVYTAGGKSTSAIAKEVSVDEAQLKEFNKWLKSSVVPTDKEYALLIPHGNAGTEFGVLSIAAAKSQPVSAPNLSNAEALSVNGIPVIRAAKGESWASLADRGNMSLKKFLRINDMSIDQPLQAGQLYFLEKKKKKAETALYTLHAGDNLWSVSQRFGVQQKSLLKFNGLSSGTKLAVGTTLYLNARNPGGPHTFDGAVALLDEDEVFAWDQTSRPVKSVPGENSATESRLNESTVTSNSTERVDVSATEETIHEVKPADTLYSVARQYGVTIQELMEWNDKKDFNVSIGEKLKVHPR